MSRILYVEDDQSSRDIMTRLLHHYHLEVDVVESGEIALDRMTHTSYDMVVIDLALPGMDGWRLLEQLQINHPNVKAMALTAYHDASVVQQAKRAGFLACLPKPATVQTAKIVQKFISQ
jgi:CheY-like chemotaxis protein